MSQDGLASFQVGSLDFGSFDAADMATTQKARPLTKPGVHDLKVTGHKLFVNERNRDGAGKMWGSLLLNTETVEGGYFMRDFIDVPLETLVHTSKAGKQTKVKSQKFINLVQAILGRKIELKELKGIIESLPSLLEGAKLSAAVNHRVGPRVAFLQNNVDGDKKYGIIIRTAGKDGQDVIYRNVDGTIAAYITREEAIAAYKAATNITPSQGLGYSAFRMKSDVKAA